MAWDAIKGLIFHYIIYLGLEKSYQRYKRERERIREREKKMREENQKSFQKRRLAVGGWRLAVGAGKFCLCVDCFVDICVCVCDRSS